jgi:hypothetical protein
VHKVNYQISKKKYAQYPKLKIFKKLKKGPVGADGATGNPGPDGFAGTNIFQVKQGQ